jgi:hypothetical protein
MLTDLPIYPKHPIRPGTDEAKIRAWKRRHRMIECEPYACTMTVKACKARHARALKAKKTTKLGVRPVLSDEWLALSKCRKCEVSHD